jgi:hypothetical protein
MTCTKQEESLGRDWGIVFDKAGPGIKRRYRAKARGWGGARFRQLKQTVSE